MDGWYLQFWSYTGVPVLGFTNFGRSRRNRDWYKCAFICHWWTSSPADCCHLAKKLSYHDATQGELESAECQLESPEYVVHAELKQAHADLRDPFWEPKLWWYAWICCDVFFCMFFFKLISFCRSFFRLVQHVLEIVARWCDTFLQFLGCFFRIDRWLLASEHNGTIQVRQQRCEFSQTPFNGTLCDS